MNRHIIHLILLTLVIIAMVACGGGGSDVPTTVPAPTPTNPTNPTPDPEPEPTPTPTPTPTPSEPQAVAIGFRADMSDAVATTRSAGDGILDDDDLQAKGFGVYCWYTGTTDFTTPKASTNMLMRNQKVEYVSSQWTYSPSKYWPLDPAEKLTFRAYAPYTDYLKEDANGMPQLPVVVKNDDYHNGSQHDPLWGTGKHDGTVDADDAATDNEVYGKLYDNYTYQMSGSLLATDNRDGIIDWYFHHGMAMLKFYAKLENKSSDPQVYITNIKISPLYTQGLLSISSAATSSSTKPTWGDRDGDMMVTLYGLDGSHTQDLATYTINKENLTLLTDPGLLVIPRPYTIGSPLTITVSYKRSSAPEDTKVFTVTTTIDSQEFVGNTIYTLNLTVGSALIADISSVNVATTKWNEKEGKEHEVYNW